MAIVLYKQDDIEQISKCGEAVAKTLKHLQTNIKIGMTLRQIDQMGEKFLQGLGYEPSFKGLYGFPSAVCTSLNEVIIHGVPDDTILKDGDILGIDIGSKKNGWYGDAAVTIPIGNISKADARLIQCSKDTLQYAIDNIKVGMRFKELSHMIEQHIRSQGFVPLFDFCGHGIGRSAHSDPDILNYLEGTNPKQGPKIKNGMVFCLEPMVCQKSSKSAVDKVDKWSVRSEDNLRTSHHEHQLAMINNKVKILTKQE